VGVVEAGRREDPGARARGHGVVAEEGGVPGAPRVGRRLHPRPRAQHRYADAAAPPPNSETPLALALASRAANGRCGELVIVQRRSRCL
jgi:hypothetical protein